LGLWRTTENYDDLEDDWALLGLSLRTFVKFITKWTNVRRVTCYSVLDKLQGGRLASTWMIIIKINMKIR